MEKILILGAGRSSNSLISYLLDHAKERNWQLTIADYALQLAEDKARGHERAKAVALDITNDQERKGLVKEHDFVVSMLPAKFHKDVLSGHSPHQAGFHAFLWPSPNCYSGRWVLRLSPSFQHVA